MKITEAVAKRIESLLKQKKMSQYRLSMESGVSQSSISEIRKCKNNGVNLYLIVELCAGFGISVRDFFNDEIFDEVDD